jgi:hypothetical protein
MEEEEDRTSNEEAGGIRVRRVKAQDGRRGEGDIER